MFLLSVEKGSSSISEISVIAFKKIFKEQNVQKISPSLSLARKNKHAINYLKCFMHPVAEDGLVLISWYQNSTFSIRVISSS